MRDWRHEATFGLTVACRRWKHLGNEQTCKWTFLPMGNGSQDLPSLAGFGNDDLATQGEFGSRGNGREGYAS